MTTQKITFTVKSINNENNVDTSVRITPLNFTDEGSNIEIVRIHFVMHDQNQKQKLDILEEQKTYELSFDDKGMEVNKSQGGPRKGKKDNTLNMCSAAGSDEDEPKKTYVMVNEGNKEIR